MPIGVERAVRCPPRLTAGKAQAPAAGVAEAASRVAGEAAAGEAEVVVVEVAEAGEAADR